MVSTLRRFHCGLKDNSTHYNFFCLNITSIKIEGERVSSSQNSEGERGVLKKKQGRTRGQKGGQNSGVLRQHIGPWYRSASSHPHSHVSPLAFQCIFQGAPARARCSDPLPLCRCRLSTVLPQHLLKSPPESPSLNTKAEVQCQLWWHICSTERQRAAECLPCSPSELHFNVSVLYI